MKNSRAKGNRVRNKVVKQLESEGWTVGIVERTGKFVKVKDLFDMWDLCAIKEDKIKFIQVKTNSTGGFIGRLQWFREHYNTAASYELWVWYDREGFKVHTA